MSLCKHKNVTLEQEQNPWWTYTKRTSQTKGNSPLVLTFHQKREVQYWGVLSMRSDLQIKFRRFTVPMGTLHFLLIWWFKAYHSKMPFAGLSIYLRTCLDGVHQDLEIVWVWRFWVDADSKSNFRKAWKFVFTHNSAYDVGSNDTDYKNEASFATSFLLLSSYIFNRISFWLGNLRQNTCKMCILYFSHNKLS